MFGRYRVDNNVRPAVVDREKERAQQLNVMFEANYNAAQDYKKLKAELLSVTDPEKQAELQKTITGIEDNLIASYPAFVEHQKSFPHAFTRQGSFSN